MERAVIQTACFLVRFLGRQCLRVLLTPEWLPRRAVYACFGLCEIKYSRASEERGFPEVDV
jgi:hypothetical protein